MFVPLQQQQQQGKGDGGAGVVAVDRSRETSLLRKTIDENEVRKVGHELPEVA